MKVFMLGWEFPPFISGGLGTACYGLTKALAELDVEITFVLPKMVTDQCASHVRMLSPASLSEQDLFRLYKTEGVSFRSIDSPLEPYQTPSSYQQRIERLLWEKQKIQGGDLSCGWESCRTDNYAGDMYTEIHRYAAIAAKLAMDEQFDVIHCHDWMTYPAGIAVSRKKARPLVAHIHATEFDRSGEQVNQMIYDIERKGLHAADKVVAVSKMTADTVVNRYGIAPEKVEVVYNGMDREGNGDRHLSDTGIERDEKIVLFLGRITMQKGPEYFLQAAKKVLDVMDNVKFVMAGSGDLMYRSVELAAELGIGDRVLFTGFLHGQKVQQIYRMADLFVMPSVSEPFGLVPLEALHNDVPVIISKQSGVSEVLSHALKVDFWDTDEMANKIVAVLRHRPLYQTLREYGNFEARKLKWKNAAGAIVNIYETLLGTAAQVAAG